MDYNTTAYVPLGRRSTWAFNFLRSDAVVNKRGETDPAKLQSERGLNCSDPTLTPEERGRVLARPSLLRLLLGELQPQTGTVRHGTHLEVAYFDQLRAQLDEKRSVLDNVGEGRDTLTVNGKSRSLIGYLEDFLFSSDRVQAPISALSGGDVPSANQDKRLSGKGRGKKKRGKRRPRSMVTRFRMNG